MNEVFRKRQTQDYLDWFEKIIGYAKDELADGDPSELGDHVRAQLVKFNCDYEELKSDPRVEGRDWYFAYLIADDLLEMCSVDLEGPRDLRDYVACVRANHVRSRKSQYMPASMYGSRAGNKSWSS